MQKGWTIPNLPSICACGLKFSLQHCMRCNKGGFVTQRHNGVRDLTVNMLKEVCVDVTVEPLMIELTGERLEKRNFVNFDEKGCSVS